MAENSKIEWTDHTFNPWIGCQKVSPGCDHCYAESMSNRYGWTTWGPHGERKRTSVANWKKPRQWNRAAQAAGVRRKVFCASLADWLDNQVPADWRMELAMLINETPHLDWLLLTKRIENYAKLSPWPAEQIPINVWLGVTAEDQEHYDRRWAILSKITANVRFISYEPAIGPIIDLYAMSALPDWLIMGGESGHGARMMDVGWAHYLRTYCDGLRVPFFFKQMTGKKPIPDDLMVRQFPASDQ
jgi:protein gp37